MASVCESGAKNPSNSPNLRLIICHNHSSYDYNARIDDYRGDDDDNDDGCDCDDGIFQTHAGSSAHSFNPPPPPPGDPGQAKKQDLAEKREQQLQH